MFVADVNLELGGGRFTLQRENDMVVLDYRRVWIGGSDVFSGNVAVREMAGGIFLLKSYSEWYKKMIIFRKEGEFCSIFRQYGIW